VLCHVCVVASCCVVFQELCKMESRARSIAELEELFELAPSKFAGLKVR
jgi:hypothetical protein